MNEKHSRQRGSSQTTPMFIRAFALLFVLGSPFGLAATAASACAQAGEFSRADATEAVSEVGKNIRAMS